MGKKRIVKKADQEGGAKAQGSSKSAKKKLDHGILCVNSTYNNTALLLSDEKGNAVAWSSSGALGFKGAKKGTPFAAGKVGDVLADKALTMGVREVDVVVKGVGSGRESSIRAFTAKGIGITSIKDTTPIPFNGPKSPKPRRV